MVVARRADTALTPAVTGPFASNALGLMQLALDAWKTEGFRYVDLPWLVPKEFCDATRPPHARDIQTMHGSFVASGEQTFLMLHTQGKLPAGAPGYVGWTPCLRDEEVLDETHQHGFIKAEWFVPLTYEELGDHFAVLTRLMHSQARIFRELALAAGASDVPEVACVRTGTLQLDLEIAGLEVGSYGLREFQGHHYLYGTALALPRFQIALARAQAATLHGA